MNGNIPLVVIGFKTVTLVLGATIAYFAGKAALKTRSTALTYLAVGFSTVTFGSLVAGIADQLFGLPTPSALVSKCSITAACPPMWSASGWVVTR